MAVFQVIYTTVSMCLMSQITAAFYCIRFYLGKHLDSSYLIIFLKKVKSLINNKGKNRNKSVKIKIKLTKEAEGQISRPELMHDSCPNVIIDTQEAFIL